MTRAAIAFWAAVAAYLLLLVVVTTGGLIYPGYSHASQFMSELGAEGAPHAQLVSLAFALIGLGIVVFSVLTALGEPRSVPRWAGFAALAVFGASYIGAALFPCDLGCPATSSSPNQIVHGRFGFAGYIAAPVGLIFLAVAAARWRQARWLSPLAILCALISVGTFMIMTGDTRGLAQRIVEGVIGVWILACAAALRRE